MDAVNATAIALTDSSVQRSALGETIPVEGAASKAWTCSSKTPSSFSSGIPERWLTGFGQGLFLKKRISIQSKAWDPSLTPRSSTL